LFNKYGAFSQAQKTNIGIAAMLGLITAIFFDYSHSNFGKRAFPYRYINILPERFLDLFFKTIGVVKDCLQSFNPDCHFANQDKSIMYDSGRISETQFGVDHNLFSMILIFAIAGSKVSRCIQISGDETGYTFFEWILDELSRRPSGEKNKTSQCPDLSGIFRTIPLGEEDDLTSDRLSVHSGRISLSRYPINRNMVPVGSRIRSPFKKTGHYEKGDCYQ